MTARDQTTASAEGMSSADLFNLAFGTIVGVGWITVLGQLLGQAGSVGLILAFLTGALLVGLIGLCYGELAGIRPTTGGEVVYAHEILGPGSGFVAGWLLVFIYVAVSAFEAISASWISSILFPGISGPVLYSLFGHDITLGALVMGWGGMAVFCWLNSRGAVFAARAQNLLTYALLLSSLVFIVAGLVGGSAENLKPYFSAPEDSGIRIDGFVAVLVTTPFWFAGFNVIPQALGETGRNFSPAQAGGLILLSIAGAAVFYSLVFLSASMTLPRPALLAMDMPAAGAFTAAFNSAFLGKMVLVAGLLGLLTTWNAVVFSGGRALFALGRSGLLSSRLAMLDPQHRMPAHAIRIVALLAAVLLPFGNGAILPLVNTVGLCFSVLFLTMAASFLVARRRYPDLERPFRVRKGGLVGSLAGGLSLLMIGLSLHQHWVSSRMLMPLEWILLVAWAMAGAVLWIRNGRRREIEC